MLNLRHQKQAEFTQENKSRGKNKSAGTVFNSILKKQIKRNIIWARNLVKFKPKMLQKNTS